MEDVCMCMFVYVCMCVYVYVYVCVRDRDRISTKSSAMYVGVKSTFNSSFISESAQLSSIY